MAQLPWIGLYKPCINLPFGDCAMYFDHEVMYLFRVPIIPIIQVQVPGSIHSFIVILQDDHPTINTADGRIRLNTWDV